MDGPRQRLHFSDVSGLHEKGKPRETCDFFATQPPQSVWKGKAVIILKTKERKEEP
jgi:hypothetical protein